jgi:AcrR family transcriptional regulator
LSGTAASATPTMSLAGTPTRRRFSREQRRELLVDAAASVFATRDPAGVTFEEIAEEAGVSRALVYNYFSDRNELLAAVFERDAAVLNQRVRAALGSVRGQREAIAAGVRVHLDFAEKDPIGYAYAMGELPHHAGSSIEQQHVRKLAELFGSSSEAELASIGIVHAVRAMVERWISDDATDADRAHEVITAFIAGSVSGLIAAGMTVTPAWVVPDRVVDRLADGLDDGSAQTVSSGR